MLIVVKGVFVIVMVYGGVWCFGDKDNCGVVKYKVVYWVNNGYIFMLLNYCMLFVVDLFI